MTDEQLRDRANLYARNIMRDLWPDGRLDVEPLAVQRAIAIAFVVGFAAGREDCAEGRHGR